MGKWNSTPYEALRHIQSWLLATSFSVLITLYICIKIGLFRYFGISDTYIGLVALVFMDIGMLGGLIRLCLEYCDSDDFVLKILYGILAKFGIKWEAE